MKNKTNLNLALKTNQRLALFGRLRMADWIEMPEEEFSRELAKIEKDPLFQKLYFGSASMPGAIRRQRWPGGRLSGSFYEINERITAGGGERVKIEEALDEKMELLPKIQKMGQEAFERYFLNADEPLTLEDIAKRTDLSVEDVRAIHDFLLEIGAQAEFFSPSRDPELQKSYACLARICLDSGEPAFEFYSPHWARGRYQIHYERLEEWKAGGDLSPDQRRRLPHLLKRLETVNLRQNTLYRILESVTQLQAEYLSTERKDRMRAISLRQLSHRLDLAPSTVSRALSGRSVRLPWNKEVPLIALVPGRRNVLREIMSEWLEGGTKETDATLVEKLKIDFGIRISRRTVNAVRNEMLRRKT